MTSNIYYWAPSMMWKVNDNGKLEIENLLFDEEVTGLFPRFYFLAQEGSTLDELKQKFNDFKKEKLEKFINILIEEKILIDGIQEIDDIFYHQSDLYKQYNHYDENLIFDEKKLNDFVEKQLLREKGKQIKTIDLSGYQSVLDKEKDRRSTRTFSNKMISILELATVLEAVSQYNQKGKIRYYYPSAGGVYPIDVYLYIKSGRVEGIDKGVYYYNPNKRILQQISTDTISNEIHYFSNKNIFDTSSGSIYLVYHADSSIPKYEDRALFYAIIDSGIIAEILTIQFEKMGLGSCIIGEIDFESIRNLFSLEKNDIYLLEMEFGGKGEK